MTLDAALIITAPGRCAREVSTIVLERLGASPDDVRRAKSRDDSAAASARGLPRDTDHYEFLPDQGLPAWVRATNLDDRFLPIAVGDFDGWKEVQDAIRRVAVLDDPYSYLVTVTFSSGDFEVRERIQGLFAGDLPREWTVEGWLCT